MKNNLLPVALFACLLLTGCVEYDPRGQHIRLGTDSLDVMVGTTATFTLTTDIHLKISFEGDAVVDFWGDNNEDGPETFTVKGLKAGHMKIRFSEGGTDRFEAVVDVNCYCITGHYEEKWDESVCDAPCEVNVSVDDPVIEAAIGDELLAEAAVRYGTEYWFDSDAMTFEMYIPSIGERFEGTYEHDKDFIRLHYDGITEKYGFFMVEGRSIRLSEDFSMKYRGLYPGCVVGYVNRSRCLMPVNIL